ncbi:hypothetical protein E2C01_055348 [Portunus trituberculatus]|uniref:Uncharacterized protein n=1 Tax=Portunus trituberculatus TaxID=210409 RepID=A0A5B7GM75_PORTR|nr:hypothetical protein [Portunus trituberculatus]
MAPKRLISGENKESGESASVSEPPHSISGFTGITPEEKLKNMFSWIVTSSAFSPPLLNYPSPAFTYGMYKSKF